MTVLVIYATVEGQTAKIATHVARRIEATHRTVTISDIRTPGFAIPGSFDAIVLCAPIHLGRYPEPLIQFIRDWKDALQQVPTALVSVSLAIMSEHADERQEAESFPEALARETGWRPTRVHHAAGALKFLEYSFFKRWIMRRISVHEGGPVDTSRDYEFTDWLALDEFVDALLTLLPAVSAPSSSGPETPA